MAALPRPGRRALVGAAYGGGGAWLFGALSWLLLWGEAQYTRRVVPVLGGGPAADGSYGEQESDQPLRLVLLGDSGAAGVGADSTEETPGALLATALAEAGHAVELRVLGVTGSRSADLEAQVRAALATPADIAVIIIGTNDVTHKVAPHRAVPKLGAAVRALRAAGVDVVVGTCPDLGAVPPIPPPLRWVARRRSREMAVAQAVAVRVAGGVAVPLGELLGPLFCRDRSMFCHDRFHPSSAGYREVAGALVPAVLAAAHTRKAGTGAAGVAPTSVGA